MTEVIIVGVDGTDTAAKAAESARDLALATGAALHVLTAFDADGTIVFGTGSDQQFVTHEEKAQKIAREAASSLGTPQLKVTYGAVRGTPAQVLIDHANQHSARMIVVGNKRMQGLGRVLGSVANTVAHHAPCDVLIAKTDA